MKKINLIGLLILLTGNFFTELPAQQVFNYFYPYDAGYQMHYLLEDQDNYLILASEYVPENDLKNSSKTSYDSACVIKWNPETSDSMVHKLLPSGYKQLHLSEIHKQTNGGYMVFGSLNPNVYPADSLNAIYIVSLDSNLNVIWEKIEELENQFSVYFIDAIYSNNGNWVGVFNSYREYINGSLIDFPTMFEINNVGQIVKLHSPDSVGFASRILIATDTAGYYLFGSFYDGLNSTGYHILLLDTNFNLIKRKYINPVNYWNDMGIDYYYEGKDTFLLSATKMFGNYREIGFYEVSIGDSTIDMIRDHSTWYSTQDDNISKHGISKTLSGNYYVVGTLGVQQSWPHHRTLINLFDSQYELVKTKIFSDPQYDVYASDAIATKDNGILLSLSYSQYQTNKKLGYRLVKLDSTLQIEWVKPIFTQTMQNDWIITPNPVKDILKVIANNPMTFKANQFNLEIIDIHGKKVFCKENLVVENLLNVHEFKSGIYVVLIKNAMGSVIYSQKIVKS